MAIFYLKNTSGSKKVIGDLGIVLTNNNSTTLDSNNTDGYLSSEMQAALLAGPALGIVLSTTDVVLGVNDTSGDLSPSDAIAALSITTRYDRDNPHQTSFAQTVTQSGHSEILISEISRLRDGSDASAATELHTHDTRYYTKTLMSGSNPGTVAVNWDNITGAPSFGSLSWQASAIVKVLGFSADMPTDYPSANIGDFALSSINDHIYRFNGTTWNDYRTPVHGDRIVNLNDGHIYSYDLPTTTWEDLGATGNDWTLLITDDGDGKAAQYLYSSSTSTWIKLADVDWGTHNAIGGRDAAGAHPSTALTYDNTESGLEATTVQAAIDELTVAGDTKISHVVYVAKNGYDTAPEHTVTEDLGSSSLPYLTIGAALSSISDASATNRYVVMVAPGTYSENVALSTPYVNIVGMDRYSSRITSASGTTLTLSSITENVNSVSNITIESTGATGSAIDLTGNNQQLKDIIINAPNGAFAVHSIGSYNQLLQHLMVLSGDIKVESGVVQLHSVISSGSLVIDGGTTYAVDSRFMNSSNDAVLQSGGTLYYVSGRVLSGSGKLDFNQQSGTIYLGLVDYSDPKATFSGTKNLLYKSHDVLYDHTASGLIATQVQAAIDELVERSSSQLTKYIVGTDPFDAYSSIQAAINDAVVDGASATNTKVILVKPGTYTGNIALPEGIKIVSMDPSNPGATFISGTITFESTVDGGTSSISGFNISSAGQSAIIESGSNIQSLDISNCNISNLSSTNPTISQDNSASQLNIDNSSVQNAGSGRAVDLVNGEFVAQNSNIDSLSNSFVASNASTFTIDTTSFGSPIVIQDSSSGFIANSTIDNGTLAAVSSNSTGSTMMVDVVNLGSGSLTSGTYPENLTVRKNAADVPYDNTTSGLASINVQDALTELATEYSVDIENIVYVAKNGNDSALGVKVGTLSNPFLTVQAALNSIIDASSTKYYIVYVMPGVYNENLQLKAWVGLMGNYKEGTSIRATTSGTHTWNAATGGRSFLHNIALGGSAQNLVVTHQSGNTSGMVLTLDNVNFGTSTFNMLGGGLDYVQIRNDCSVAGLMTIHSAACTANDSTFTGGIIMDDVGVEVVDSYGSASSNTLKDCMGSSITCVGNVWAEFYNCYSWSTMTANGALCTVSYDVQSAPDSLASLISLNGGTFQRTDNSFALSYDNTTSGMVATQVQAAIDELKSNISSFKMPSGTVLPGSPDDGDLFYLTTMSTPFQYDESRGKWLSMSKQTLDWGTNSADGKYYNIHGAAASQSGYLMPRAGTVISITYKIASGNLTKPVELRRNNAAWSSTPADYTFTPVAGTYSNTTLNLNFVSGDYIQVFSPSNGVPARDAVVMIEFAYLGV